MHGVGVGGLAEPDTVLDLGNSGTAVRLLAGICASHGFTTVMTGDASLRRRPMGRIIEPLERMGARFEARSGGRLPFALIGADQPLPIEYRLPVASAQVKSAVLLAGLNAPGETRVIEPAPSRDHTERMLRRFGAQVGVEAHADGGSVIAVTGYPELQPCVLTVPGDPSAAAFPMAAALIVPGSDIVIRQVGVNPGRIGLFETLREMGAKIEMGPRRELGSEPLADIAVRAGPLRGVEVPAARAPSMIDEYPILSADRSLCRGHHAAQRPRRAARQGERQARRDRRGTPYAAGVTVTRAGRRARYRGVRRPATRRWLGGDPPRSSHFAMAFLILGMASGKPMTIDDGSMIGTSYPGFVADMNRSGSLDCRAVSRHRWSSRSTVRRRQGREPSPAASRRTTGCGTSIPARFTVRLRSACYAQMAIRLRRRRRQRRRATITAADLDNPALRERRRGAGGLGRRDPRCCACGYCSTISGASPLSRPVPCWTDGISAPSYARMRR